MPAIYYTIPVHFCDLTFESPAENLACDEALLDWCEAGQAAEILRVWEPSKAFVVLGYANRAASEANLSFCQKNNIPVHRRCTGGGAVLQEVGVLMNLNVDSAKVKTILQDTWRACAKPCELPLDQVSRLAQGKYSRDDWNFKF